MFSLMHYLINGDYYSAVMFVLSSCFVVFCCLPIHEYAHGLAHTNWAMTRQNDKADLLLILCHI